LDKVEKYIQDLKDSNSTSKRFSAYKLGIIGSMKAFEPLLDALNDHNPFVRSNVAEALGNLGNVGAISPLAEHLNDMDFTVRFSVIEAMGVIAKLNPGAERSLFNDIIPKLIESLDDEKYIIRHIASDSLAKIGGELVEEQIQDVLINGSDIAREFAIWTIGKLGNEFYEEQLLDIFEETDNDYIKRAILYTLDALNLNVAQALEDRGYNPKEVKDELFDDEIFNDKLFYNI
jgi:HEAT repeat protein